MTTAGSGGWGPARDPPPAPAERHGQAFLAVQAIDPFEVDAVAFATEQDMQPAIPKAPPFGGQGPQALAQGEIGRPPGPVATRRQPDPHQGTRPAFAHAVLRLNRPHRRPLRRGRQAFFPRSSLSTW
jgi:hypothetical protein